MCENCQTSGIVDEEQELEDQGLADARVWTVRLDEERGNERRRQERIAKWRAEIEAEMERKRKKKTEEAEERKRRKKADENEEFKECEAEDDIWVPEGVSIVALHFQDEDDSDEEDDEEKREDGEEKKEEDDEKKETDEEQKKESLQVNMVRAEDDGWTDVTLDSGADISVLPFGYFDVGSPVDAGDITMVDAQGKKIKNAGSTRASLFVTDAAGKIIEIKEKFVIGNVKNPLLCAGKFLRRGWQVTQGSCGLCLTHPNKSTEIPLKMHGNRILLEAKIQTVSLSTEDTDTIFAKKGVPKLAKAWEKREFEELYGPVPDESLRVCVLEGYLGKELKSIEKSPGWHRLPNGVLAHSDAVAYKFLSPKGMVGMHWKCRLTFMKKQDSSGVRCLGASRE